MTRPDAITDRWLEAVVRRLANNEQVRRSLPDWGRVHIDRQLPFLCVYRKPPGRADPETERLVTGEASYLIARGGRKLHPALSRLVSGIVETLGREFGAFLLLEAWAGSEPEGGGDLAPAPAFRIHVREPRLASTIDKLRTVLAAVHIGKRPADVAVSWRGPTHPPNLSPLAPDAACFRIGLEVAPIWRRGDDLFPLLRRAVTRNVARALKRTCFEFTNALTTHRPRHYHVLGRRAFVKAAREADRRLAEIDDAFDFLLLMTPANADAAYREFKRSGFERRPAFLYRPLPADPAVLKRHLFEIGIERVEDPTLAHLFRQKRRELDLKLSALFERNSRSAYYIGLQLYGPVEDDLLDLARKLLARIPPRSREGKGPSVDAEAFAARAREELEHYRRLVPDLPSRVEVRRDLSGLIVSKGNLLVGASHCVAPSRVEALIQHEVGTHVVTYLNGLAQPFRQLHCGLAGYDELQEGIAVLAEHLVGGLSRPRLRILAARVVAARCLTEGASFAETFRVLREDHGIEREAAFTVVMRVFRGGGLTKDAIYLRGLVALLNYLRDGGELEPLLSGKISADHIPVVEELRRRGVLRAPLLRPRYMEDDEARVRLDAVRQGNGVFDLVPEKQP